MRAPWWCGGTTRGLCLLVVLVAGCLRTAYPDALLVSQHACAQLLRDCGEAAKAGHPCVRLPRCPMQATVETTASGTWRDLGLGWPFVRSP